MSLVYCPYGYMEAGCCTCIVFLWLQRGKLLDVEHVTCILSIWLHGGRLLYVYSLSMVTERQVAGRGACHLYIV